MKHKKLVSISLIIISFFGLCKAMKVSVVDQSYHKTAKASIILHDGLEYILITGDDVTAFNKLKGVKLTQFENEMNVVFMQRLNLRKTRYHQSTGRPFTATFPLKIDEGTNIITLGKQRDVIWKREVGIVTN